MSLTTNTAKVASVQRLRRISRLLDNAIAIPGTNFRIGLDSILGLLPGAGDFVGAALSSYIVIEAARLGVPKEALGRMVVNVLLESAVGTVPVLGDVFDVAWKANVRNVELLEAHLNVPQPNQKQERWFIFLLLAGLFIFGVAMVALGVVLMRLLVRAVSGS